MRDIARNKGLSAKERQALRELIDSPGAADEAEGTDDGPKGGRGRKG